MVDCYAIGARYGGGLLFLVFVWSVGMSDPKVDYPESARGAVFEVMSAMSALNMYPEPLPLPEGADPERYLSECDGWAKHSMQHLHAAVQLCNKAEEEHNRLRYMLEWMLVHKCGVPSCEVCVERNTMGQLNAMFAKIVKAQ
jgi:hypothetical protein